MHSGGFFKWEICRSSSSQCCSLLCFLLASCQRSDSLPQISECVWFWSLLPFPSCYLKAILRFGVPSLPPLLSPQKPLENWGICQSIQAQRESPKPWLPLQKEQAWHLWLGSPGKQSHLVRWGIKSIPLIFFCMPRICSLSCPGQWLHLCSVWMAQPQQSQALHPGAVTPSPHLSQPPPLVISLQECWTFIGPDEIEKNR